MARIRISQGSGEWKPLPEGMYDFRILELKMGESAKKNPQLQVSMVVLGGEYDDKKANTFYSLLPQALWNLYALTDALGIERTETGELDSSGKPIYEFEADDLVGCCVRFNVGQREYQGKVNNTFNNPQVSPHDTMYAQITQGNPAAAAQPQPAPVAQPVAQPVAAAQPVAQPQPQPAAAEAASAPAGAVRRRARATA